LDHVEDLYAVFRNLLEERNTIGLKSFYEIIKRISPGHVRDMANRFQASLADIAIATFTTTAATEFCNELFSFINAYKDIVNEQFEGLHEFRAAMDQACVAFINSGVGW
jgi:hypothetical protein